MLFNLLIKYISGLMKWLFEIKATLVSAFFVFFFLDFSGKIREFDEM